MTLPDDLKTTMLTIIAHMSTDRQLYELPVRMWTSNPDEYIDGYLLPIYDNLYLHITYDRLDDTATGKDRRLATRKSPDEGWVFDHPIGDMYIHIEDQLWESAKTGDIDLVAKTDHQHRYAILVDGQIYYDPTAYSDHITAYDTDSQSIEIPTQLVDYIIRTDNPRPTYKVGYYTDDFGDTYIHTMSGWWVCTQYGLKPITESRLPLRLDPAHITDGAVDSEALKSHD